jgi:membrane fusion protein (multidrug efflux system)
LLILSSCGKEEQQATQGPGLQSKLPRRTPRHTEIRPILRAANVEIRPKVNGFIQKIYVDEGQTVRKTNSFQIRN